MIRNQSITTPCLKHKLGKENNKNGTQDKARQVRSKEVRYFPADGREDTNLDW